ncbi:MAG: carnitine dehydratase [Gordonia sp.]|nr:carnitine dehydratase [Gordonia sp. (in: high G+C Gram-positive bacteria)]
MPHGPLAGVRVVELACLGPGAFATMLLGDLGADVVRIDRADSAGQFPGSPRTDLLNRNKRSIVLDLKTPGGISAARALIDRADVVVDGSRPGVTERLGLGPATFDRSNPKLVYGRASGWGQTGPAAQQPGHDINFIAVTGALHAIGEAGGPPQIPVNLVGNFAGGSLYLVIGILSALRVAEQTGHGQTVDAATIDGTLHMMTSMHSMLAANAWDDQRGLNVTDGGAPFYAVYETADGEYMSVGAMEPKFFSVLVRALEIPFDTDRQYSRELWPALRASIAQAFATQTQAYWSDYFERHEACVSPVLSIGGAAAHEQIADRASLVEVDGIYQSAPAPRFSRTDGAIARLPPIPGEHTDEILQSVGLVAADLLAEKDPQSADHHNNT